MLKIQIPKPCHEDWNKMNPTQQGAFCGACNKEIVDFTKMTDIEVQYYFLNKAAGETCGRFRTEQIDRIQIYLPENILFQQMAGWKKFMVVILLAFGSLLFGCETGMKQNTIGKPENSHATLSDTLNSESSQPLGIITPEWKDSAVTQINCMGKSEIDAIGPPIQTLLGDIEIIPDTIAPLTMGKPMLIEEPAIIDTNTKKPVPDTSKCKDTGYY